MHLIEHKIIKKIYQFLDKDMLGTHIIKFSFFQKRKNIPFFGKVKKGQ